MLPTIWIFNIQLPTFFLALSLTSTLCLVLIRQRVARWIQRYFWLDRNFHHHVWNLTFILLCAGLLGSRFAHVFYEQPGYYAESPLRIFFIWQGGFVFLGGFLVAVVAGLAYLVLRVKKIDRLVYFDFFAPILSLSLILGRIGCFLNGCCYGAFCDLPWAVSFSDENGLIYPRHPTQLYSAGWELLILIWLIVWQKKKNFYLNLSGESRTSQLGSLFHVWLFLHSFGRFFIEFFRDDFRGPQYILSFSGWISLGLCLWSAWFLLLRKKSALR